MQLRARPTPGAAATVTGQQVVPHTCTYPVLIIIPTLQAQVAPPPPVVTMLIENDLAIELQDEYDPLAPNNYESIYLERKVKQEKVREEEVRLN